MAMTTTTKGHGRCDANNSTRTQLHQPSAASWYLVDDANEYSGESDQMTINNERIFMANTLLNCKFSYYRDATKSTHIRTLRHLWSWRRRKFKRDVLEANKIHL